MDTIDITDRFDSASETGWRMNNWNLGVHTPNYFILIVGTTIMTVMFGFLGLLTYSIGEENRFSRRMNSLYEPYKSAVVELDKLQYCTQDWCDERRVVLGQQREDAWIRVCENDDDGRYLNRLVNKGLPNQQCD